jgi:hypothetical protein
MRALAAFIMQGRLRAVLVAALSAVPGLILVPLQYLSGASVALVTLRAGPKDGLLVTVLAGLLVGLGGTLLLGNAVLGVGLASGLVGGLWLPLWLMAWVLRRTISLPAALAAAGLLGAAFVIAVFLSVDDMEAFWGRVLDALRTLAGEQGNGALGGLKLNLEDAARIATGAVAANMVLGLVLSLMLARWWQSLLYNPGGFRKEFHALRLGQGTALAVMGIFALTLVPGDNVSILASNLSFVAVVIYMVNGLALAHWAVASSGASAGWLAALYGLMVFALPYVAVLLAVVGLADSWANLRQRLHGLGIK